MPEHRCPIGMERRLSEHRRGAHVRWLALVIAVGALYVIAAVISVAAISLLNEVRHTARQGQAVGCTLVQQLESAISQSKALNAATETALKSEPPGPQQQSKLLALRERERGIVFTVNLTNKLKSEVDCPAHMEEPSIR